MFDPLDQSSQTLLDCSFNLALGLGALAFGVDEHELHEFWHAHRHLLDLLVLALRTRAEQRLDFQRFSGLRLGFDGNVYFFVGLLRLVEVGFVVVEHVICEHDCALYEHLGSRVHDQIYVLILDVMRKCNVDSEVFG